VGDAEALYMDVHVQRASTRVYQGQEQKTKETSRWKADLGGKLKTVCDEAPIHSPKSRALASDTPQATIRVFTPVCAETYRVREMMTS